MDKVLRNSIATLFIFCIIIGICLLIYSPLKYKNTSDNKSSEWDGKNFAISGGVLIAVGCIGLYVHYRVIIS